MGILAAHIMGGIVWWWIKMYREIMAAMEMRRNDPIQIRNEMLGLQELLRRENEAAAEGRWWLDMD